MEKLEDDASVPPQGQGPGESSVRSSSSSGSSSSGGSSESSDGDVGGTNGDGGEGTTNGRSSSEELPPMMPPPPPAVSTLCRICMCDPAEDGRTLESLFRTTVDSKTLYAMLVSVCAPLGQVNNDGMPDKVCQSCKAKLVQAYKLYETCVKSDERLRKLLQLQNSAGGVLIKQEIIDEDDEDAEITNYQLYCDAQVKKEDEYEQDYLFDGGYYGGVGLAAAEYNTPNLRIQSVHNGPEVLVQLQEGQLSPAKVAVEWDKYVKVTPNGHNCILCGRDFKYFSYFKQHAIAQHDPNKPHKCAQCKYTFKTEQRLFIHMRTHLEQAEELPLAVEHAELPEPELEIEGSLDLDQSDDQIMDDDSVSISINPENGEKIYTCLICQKQLTTLPLYRRHQTVHTVRGRPYECDICHYRFAMKFSYNAHMLRHEQGKDPATPAHYKCTECDETFNRRKLLNLHIAVNHQKPTVYLNKTAPAAILTSNISEGRGGHACPICSETFNRESVLNNHMKLHELEAAQLKHSEICYICNVCGIECETRESFSSHIKTHGDNIQLDAPSNSLAELDDDDVPPQNGAEPQHDPLSTSTPSKSSNIRCELCSKTFPYACNLKQHRIIHHSELKPHECHICHYRFEYEGTLMRHMQKHSKQELSAATSTPSSQQQPLEDSIVAPAGSSLIFKCKLCSARFQKQKSMTWHLKTHRSIVAAGEQDKEQSPVKEGGAGGLTVAAGPLSPNSVAANAFAARLDLKPQSPQSQSQTTSAMQQIQQLQAMRGGAGGTTKMYKCGYCPQKLDSEEAYFQHLKGHRVRPAPTDPLLTDEETPPAKKKRSWVRSGEHHKCHLCQKVFTFRSQLQQHTALHHQPGKPYECGKCHYSFVHKLNLKRHELTHLEEERVASEDDPSINLLEDESFNADLEELVEPVMDEMSPATVGLMPVKRDEGQDKTGEGSGAGGAPKKNKCVVCAAHFQREDQLIEHLKTHIERMKVTKQESQSAKKGIAEDSDKKCKLCSKVFKFTCQLKQHVQMHHSKDKPFECNICRYRFEFKGHMLRHKANNHPNEVAAEEADSDELPAKITTPTVNPDGSEVYQCPVCPMNFVKQRSLTWHLKTHTGKTRIKREDGGSSYPSASSSSMGEVFQCRVCTRMFNDAYELKSHMLTHAGSSSTSSSGRQAVVEADHSLFGSGLDMMLQDFPDTMEDTDPLFDGSNLELVLEDNFEQNLDFSVRYNQQQDTSTLSQNKRTGMNDNSSVYDVAEAGQASTTTPAKGKIVCELCKKDFLYSCNLKQHMQLHHAKEKPFECKICFYRFEYSGHLVRHIRTNHDNQQEDAIGDAIERNFVCTFCSELFEQKSQLNSHIQTYHRGEKQFKCDMCPASFAYKKTFENHREEHHSIKPETSTVATAAVYSAAPVVAPSPNAGSSSSNYSCNLCKKTFSSAQKVDNHVCFQ